MAAAASVFHGEGGEASRAEGFHGFAHIGLVAGKKDLDAHLVEAHEGTHAHAASQQGRDAVLRQILHGAMQPPCWWGMGGRVD